jgi:hypothetical protein
MPREAPVMMQCLPANWREPLVVAWRREECLKALFRVWVLEMDLNRVLERGKCIASLGRRCVDQRRSRDFEDWAFKFVLFASTTT